MYGMEDVPLLPHAMLAEVMALTDGHVALGAGQVDPQKFTLIIATNGPMTISAAIESRF